MKNEKLRPNIYVEIRLKMVMLNNLVVICSFCFTLCVVVFVNILLLCGICCMEVVRGPGRWNFIRLKIEKKLLSHIRAGWYFLKTNKFFFFKINFLPTHIQNKTRFMNSIQTLKSRNLILPLCDSATEMGVKPQEKWWGPNFLLSV